MKEHGRGKEPLEDDHEENWIAFPLTYRQIRAVFYGRSQVEAPTFNFSRKRPQPEASQQ